MHERSVGYGILLSTFAALAVLASVHLRHRRANGDSLRIEADRNEVARASRTAPVAPPVTPPDAGTRRPASEPANGGSPQPEKLQRTSGFYCSGRPRDVTLVITEHLVAEGKTTFNREWERPCESEGSVACVRMKLRGEQLPDYFGPQSRYYRRQVKLSGATSRGRDDEMTSVFAISPWTLAHALQACCCTAE